MNAHLTKYNEFIKTQINKFINIFKNDKKLILTIIILFFISRLSLFIVHFIYNLNSSNPQNIIEALFQWDANWYLTITKTGYTPEPINLENQAPWAFSPLYPLIVRIVNYIIPINTKVLGVILSNIFILIGSFFSTKYFLTRTKNTDYIPHVFLCLCGPYSFYFATYYAEALFFMLLALFLYSLSQKRYITAGIFSALATMTRAYGIFIVFMMLIFIYQENFTKLNFKNFIQFIKKIFTNSNYLLGILLCPLGHFLYMGYLYLLVGDIWAFYRVTIVGWNSNSNPSFNILNNLFNINRPALFYLDILFILAVITIIYLIYKKHYPEATIGITTISTHFDSQYNIARHCLGLYFPIMAITLFINKHKKLKPLFYISFYILEMCLLYFWFDHKYFLV